MDVSVVKYTGEITDRRVVLPSEIFGVEPNDHAVYLDVKLIFIIILIIQTFYEFYTFYVIS